MQPPLPLTSLLERASRVFAKKGRVFDKTSGRQLAERIKSRGRAARPKKS
jgi:hypothetical protein